MMKNILTLAALSCLSLTCAQAEIIKSIGEGKAAVIKKDQNLTRNQALNSAKLDAVNSMMTKINGPQSTHSAQQFLDQITKQIDPSYFTSLGSQVDENKDLVTKVSLEMDDQEFRTILNDYGLAKKNSRLSPIMIVMDEYFGVPRDNTKPVKEFTSYYNDQSYSHNENAKYSNDESLKASSKAASSSKTRASSGYVGAYANGRGGAAIYAGKSNYANQNSRSSASNLNYKGSERASYSENEQQNDIQSFVKYVEYQTPSTTPEKVNHTLNSIAQNAAKYDLRMMDSDLFRSKYLKGRSMSIQELLSDSELARFASAARQEKADWFMAGSTNIFDRGHSQTATGEYACDGAISFKVYSVDDATLMTGETRTESALGNTAEACRANVAAKLGQLAMGAVGPQILNYSKNRSMYGKEITLLVKSPSNHVATSLGDDLFVAVEGITGAEDVNLRTQDGHVVELTLNYKSNRPLTVELAKALRGTNPALATASRKQEGNTVMLCIGGEQCK